jgi:hypothetical protein
VLWVSGWRFQVVGQKASCGGPFCTLVPAMYLFWVKQSMAVQTQPLLLPAEATQLPLEELGEVTD